MSEIRTAGVVSILIITMVTIPLFSQHAKAANTILNGAGDWGCKTAAKDNVKQIGKQGKPLIGLGDYGYKCSSKALTALWKPAANVQKKGVPGNHECLKGQNPTFASGLFNYGSCTAGPWAQVFGGNVALIGINEYIDYSPGSTQHNYITQKSEEFHNDPAIRWIGYVYHEGTYAVKCSKDHCHAPNGNLKAVIDPIVKKYGGFLWTAHTHLTAFGVLNNIPVISCGGGGEDGTSLKSNNGFTYASSKMGFCNLEFTDNSVVAKHVSPSGQVLATDTINHS